MKPFKVKWFDGSCRREKVVLAESYEQATRPLQGWPPGYIWTCEPVG
jgi:hypothetical protein